MAEKFVTQSATPATLDANVGLAGILGTFGAETNAVVGPAALVEVQGAAGARVITVLGRVKSGVPTAIPTSLTAVTNFGGSTDYFLDGLLVVNASGAEISVGLTDGGDRYVVPTQPVPAHSQLLIPMHGLPATGAKWVASGSGLTGVIWGKTAQ
jgi:hypothetical protein